MYMIMKELIYTLLLFIMLYSCSIDNYEAPNAVLSGKVVDNKTNELVENGGANGGTVIHVFEGNSIQPIICNSFPDGRFMNAAFFSGNYKIVAIGAFQMASDTVRVSVSNNTEVEIKVLPNVRLKASIVNRDASSITVKVEYEKVHASQVLNELCVVWSTYPNPNMFTFAGGGQKVEKVSTLNLTSGEKTFVISELNPGLNYHVRAAARTNAAGNYYNYSKPIQTR